MARAQANVKNAIEAAPASRMARVDMGVILRPRRAPGRCVAAGSRCRNGGRDGGKAILYFTEITLMPTKVNIVLDDDVKADLDRMVEAGMRSRVVNRALRRKS